MQQEKDNFTMWARKTYLHDMKLHDMTYKAKTMLIMLYKLFSYTNKNTTGRSWWLNWLLLSLYPNTVVL